MRKGRMSLMTFNIDSDLACGAMEIMDVLHLAKDAGIPFVDLMNISPEDIPAYRSAMQETDVRAACYIASVDFLRQKEHWLPQLHTGLQAAAALSAQRMMIVPFSDGKDLRLAETMDREAVLARMTAGFTAAVEEGKKQGIPICFETTPHDILCLSGTDDCLRVLKAVPGLGLAFDTANMLPHGDDPIEAYEALKSSIVHVHLKDVALIDGKAGEAYWEKARDGRGMQCVVWGEGEIPVMEIYRRLLRDGYNGLFAIEYTHPEEQASGKDSHLEHLRRFFREEETQ
ncbi:MAG: sugar phosphate isomerase/epimerase [Clostridia bacterium]|nr:sugar phosphate isomerase/epimerase [Clostridia bacterium]